MMKPKKQLLTKTIINRLRLYLVLIHYQQLRLHKETRTKLELWNRWLSSSPNLHTRSLTCNTKLFRIKRSNLFSKRSKSHNNIMRSKLCLLILWNRMNKNLMSQRKVRKTNMHCQLMTMMLVREVSMISNCSSLVLNHQSILYKEIITTLHLILQSILYKEITTTLHLILQSILY